MADVNIVQIVSGGKWHRAWWTPRYEHLEGVFVTHVGAYRPDVHPMVKRDDVASSDLCRQCFRTHA